MPRWPQHDAHGRIRRLVVVPFAPADTRPSPHAWSKADRNERQTTMTERTVRRYPTGYGRVEPAARPYPHTIWVCTVTEYPLTGTDDTPDRTAAPTTVDVLAFPADTTTDTKRARAYGVDNTYVDVGRRTYRVCDVRLVEVRR